MKILQFSTCYKSLRNFILERSDRLFNLNPWDSRIQSPEFEVSFREKFQTAGYNQTLVALGLGLAFAAFLEVNYLGVYGWPTPTSVLRGLIVLFLGFTFVLLVGFERFARKHFASIVAVVFTVILGLLCCLAINLPHEGVQLLATIPNILLTYLFLFGFARIPITVSVPVALCAVPLAILVLQSHDQPIGAQIGSALNLLIFIVAGTLLSKSIERRERALHIATFRSEVSKINQTRDLGHVLHDLRNPLLAIELTLSGMRAECKKHHDYAAVQRLGELLSVMGEVRELTTNALDDTAALSRISAENAVATDLAMIIDVVANETQAILNSETTKLYLLGSVSVEVLSDSLKLKTVFRNLIGNAIKFPDIEKPLHTIVIRTKVITNQVFIFVHDNGKGISSNSLRKIWIPGFTTGSTIDGQVGKGLGLSLVKAVCDSLPGHRLSVKSAVGKGTSFMLILPCAPRPFAQRPAEVARRSSSRLEVKDELCVVEVAEGGVTTVVMRSTRERCIDLGSSEARSTDLETYVSLMDLPLDVLIFESLSRLQAQLELYKLLVNSQGFIPVVAVRRKSSRYQVVEIGNGNVTLLFQVNFETLLALGIKNQALAQRRILEQ